MMAPKKTPLHKFHLVLADNTERDLTGASFTVHDGSLVLLDGDKDATVAYAPNAWRYCERESRDDRG